MMVVKSRIAGRVVVAILALGAMLIASGGALAKQHRARVTHATATTSVAPNPRNELDCNGWSAHFKSVRPAMRALCTDPIRITGGNASRLLDNGWYVGHDEPSVKFISSTPGSGNTMSYLMQLPVDPTAAPTADGSVTSYGELSPAPWFGLPICDPNSYPQNPCAPDSDTNSGDISDPNGAGSAFMELQFYPPGFTPFIDSASCSPTKWCSAVNIDSLEATFNFAYINPNCVEPVNFAFLQRNGVPAGPPSPQLTDVSTFTPNSHTLRMSSGDVLLVEISDPSSGFTTKVTDLNTGQSGYMVASAANGFMNTSIADCSGTPHTFHAEYSSAKPENQVPWAALEGGVLMEQEIGHYESCNSLSNQNPFNASYPDGSTYSDPNVYDTCNGGTDGANASGEGPCSGATCLNATTQGPNGPVACPTNDAASGFLCEFADGSCMQAGSRTAMVDGTPTTEVAKATGCQDNRYQNGDLDFDGNSYIPDWPNGTGNFPTSIQYAGPFMASGKPYPQVQFETDVAGSENLCDLATGDGCTAPPISAAFYPFWSLGKFLPRPGTNVCTWNFGNDIAGSTVTDFGQNAQYGTANLARYAGTVISAVQSNPQNQNNSAGCKPLNASSAYQAMRP
jgi:hypothetical protein